VDRPHSTDSFSRLSSSTSHTQAGRLPTLSSSLLPSFARGRNVWRRYRSRRRATAHSAGDSDSADWQKGRRKKSTVCPSAQHGLVQSIVLLDVAHTGRTSAHSERVRAVRTGRQWTFCARGRNVWRRYRSRRRATATGRTSAHSFQFAFALVRSGSPTPAADSHLVGRNHNRLNESVLCGRADSGLFAPEGVTSGADTGRDEGRCNCLARAGPAYSLRVAPTCSRSSIRASLVRTESCESSKETRGNSQENPERSEAEHDRGSGRNRERGFTIDMLHSPRVRRSLAVRTHLRGLVASPHSTNFSQENPERSEAEHDRGSGRNRERRGC
jgi:hypothetical protein